MELFSGWDKNQSEHDGAAVALMSQLLGQTGSMSNQNEAKLKLCTTKSENRAA
jgi:hypothetical protein